MSQDQPYWSHRCVSCRFYFPPYCDGVCPGCFCAQGERCQLGLCVCVGKPGDRPPVYCSDCRDIMAHFPDLPCTSCCDCVSHVYDWRPWACHCRQSDPAFIATHRRPIPAPQPMRPPPPPLGLGPPGPYMRGLMAQRAASHERARLAGSNMGK